jgi:hypothetical protein
MIQRGTPIVGKTAGLAAPPLTGIFCHQVLLPLLQKLDRGCLPQPGAAPRASPQLLSSQQREVTSQPLNHF